MYSNPHSSRGRMFEIYHFQKQIWLWPSSSKNIYVRPSVCLLHFSQCSSHRIIMELLPLTKVMSKQKVKFRSQRSISQKSKQMFPPIWAFPGLNAIFSVQIATQWCKYFSGTELVLNCFWGKAYINFQGHTGQKIDDVDPNWACPDCNSSLNSLMSLKWCTTHEVA